MGRRLKHHVFRLLTGGCAAAACGVLGVILWAIGKRGWPAVSWRFFTEQIRLVGADGGIFYNLLGTGILLGTAFLVSAPVAVSVALTHSVYLKPARRGGLAMLLYILNGVPSILFGIFGLMVFVRYLEWDKSWLTGGILLGFMILPTVTIAVMERIDAIPREYIELAAALGLRQSQIVRSVVLPQSVSGLVTGSLLGLARAAGETAPIMFTATIFAGATLPQGIRDSPVLTLPYHIFILAQDSYDPAAGSKLWGTALTLLLLVFTLSLLTLPARRRFHQAAHYD